MRKKKPGRRTIMTQEVIDKLEYAFALGCTDNEACLHAGISPATLYNHQERDPKFLERKDLLKSKPIFLARETVLRGVKENPDIALRFLERKKKDEFSLRTETDISTLGQSLNRPYEGLTKEQILEALKQGKTDVKPDGN